VSRSLLLHDLSSHMTDANSWEAKVLDTDKGTGLGAGSTGEHTLSNIAAMSSGNFFPELNIPKCLFSLLAKLPRDQPHMHICCACARACVCARHVSVGYPKPFYRGRKSVG
jgi:hypothetical protein